MRLAAALALLAFVPVAAETRYFRYERILKSSQTGQSCLALDAATFAHAANRLSDLRLYREGAETPYVIRQAEPTRTEPAVVSPINLGLRGGQTVFDARLPEGNHGDIELGVSAQNFIATVSVSGSRLEPGAETRLGDFTIFDLTGQKLGRSTILHLPQSDFPYLHFRIHDASPAEIKPSGIGDITLVRPIGEQPQYSTVAQSSQIVQKGHRSLIEFSLPSNVPVDRVLFLPGAQPPNFSRGVTLAVAYPAQPPPDAAESVEPPQSIVSSGNILRYHGAQGGHRIDEENLAVAVPVSAPPAGLTQPARWKIDIDNGDDPPLQLQSVQLQMFERRLCFEAVAGAGYTLYYGDPALAAPSYDYATLFRPEANPAQLPMPAEQVNPGYRARPDSRPFTEKHPALLWAALLAVIALLGLIALRTARRPAAAA